MASVLLQLSSPGQTAGLGQPVSSTFPPSQQPQHTEPPSKVMESGLFPEALLLQHYTGSETSKLSSSGGTEAFSCSSHPICDNLHLGQLVAARWPPCRVVRGSSLAGQVLLHSESPWCCFHTPGTSQVLAMLSSPLSSPSSVVTTRYPLQGARVCQLKQKGTCLTCSRAFLQFPCTFPCVSLCS